MKCVKNVRNGLRTEISGSGYLESARNFDPNPMAMVPDPKIRFLGSKIYKNNDEMLINAVRTEKALDPTGCGDAYRAGFLFSIKKNYSLEKSAKLSSIIAKFKVESIGPQNHFFDFDTLKREYEVIYNDSL